MASSRPLCLQFSAWDRHTNKFHPRRSVDTEGTWCNWGGQGKLSRNGTPNGIPTHMHNSRDSTRRLSRAMPSGCTSLPESPLLPDAVSAEPNASSATPHPHPGAASDPPRLLQGPAFHGRLSQKTNSKLFRQSKLRASHPAPGATTLPEQPWPQPPPPLLFSLSLKRK